MITGKLNIAGTTTSKPTTAVPTSKPSEPGDFNNFLEIWAKGRTQKGELASKPVSISMDGKDTNLDEGNYGGLGKNFSFFFRVSTTFRQQGQGMEDMFLKTTESLAETLSRNTQWTGNPVGSYLNGAVKTLVQGATSGTDYLKQILAASQQGMQAIIAGLGSNNSTGLSSQTSSSSIFTQPSSGALDIAYLRLTSAQDLGAAPTAGVLRPPARMADGHDLIMVSDSLESAAASNTDSADTTSQPSPQMAHAFMDRFLDLVKDFIGARKSGTVHHARPTAVEINITVGGPRIVPEQVLTESSIDNEGQESENSAVSSVEEVATGASSETGTAIKGVGNTTVNI